MSHHEVKLFTIFFALLLQTPSLMADDEMEMLLSLSLENLSQLRVTTVSRVSEDRDHAPGSVYVVTQQMIKKRGYRSLKDVLQIVPGFTVFHKDLQFVAGVRGLNSNDNEKITLLINGRESNGVYEADFLNGPINLDSLDRVEITVGPSSLFQQANTLAATINLITKRVEGVETVIAHGNDQPYGATVMAGKRWNEDRFVSASMTYEKKDGFDAWDEINRPILGQRGDITGKLEPSLFAHVEGNIDNWWGQIIVLESNNGAELNIESAGLNNDGSLEDKLYQFDLAHTYEWSPELTSKASFSIAYKQQDRLNKGGFPPDGGLELRNSQRDYKTEFGIEYSGFNDHFIQAGVQFAFEDNFDTFYTFNQEKKTLVDDDTHALGIYLSDKWQYNDKLQLVAGLRADDNTIIDQGVYWGGRFAAIYDVSDNWISKVMVNRAVRMPTPLSALNKEWGTNNTNPPAFANLSPTAQKPETLTTYEWQNIVYFKDTRVSATLYYQDLRDFLTWLAPHTNAGDYSGYGLELDIVHTFSKDLSMWLTASYVNSEFEPFFDLDPDPSVIGDEHIQVNSDGEIVGSPEVVINMGIDYQLNKQLNFNGQLRYFTRQTAYSLKKQDFEKIDNRVYLDAAMTYEDFLFDGVDLRLSGQNILNNRKKVATQWSKSEYEPRGATYLMTIFAEF